MSKAPVRRKKPFLRAGAVVFCGLVLGFTTQSGDDQAMAQPTTFAIQARRTAETHPETYPALLLHAGGGVEIVGMSGQAQASSITTLVADLRRLLGMRAASRRLFVRVDADLTYLEFMRVMNVLQNSGYDVTLVGEDAAQP